MYGESLDIDDGVVGAGGMCTILLHRLTWEV